jgi:hypothetical protein
MSILDEQARPQPPYAADEVATVLGFLDFQRAYQDPIWAVTWYGPDSDAAVQTPRNSPPGWSGAATGVAPGQV